MLPGKRKPPTRTHRQMVETWRKDPEFKSAYDELETEFAQLRELLAARRRAGLTQAGVAARIGTRPPSVTRLETALSHNKHSPTLATLKKYARAVGCRLEVHLVRSKAR
ncbi:MAG: helix-turn-helix transcriptional regulator [Deltaproteobacteria bacterium]|nr:helix-turn-helix transcriptional regulator [Deltaproteobacteria bacterium]